MIGIKVNGLPEFKGKLNQLPRAIVRGVVNSINRTGTASRKQVITQVSGATGIKAKLLRQRLGSKRASVNRPDLLIWPSSAGVDVKEYRYHMERVGAVKNITRARIRVDWLNSGRKIAAGFINPLGKKRAALRTRASKGTLKVPKGAIGPSVAAIWKAMPKQPVETYARRVLLENITRDVPSQISKVTR